MNEQTTRLLRQRQLAVLEGSFHQGAQQASHALAKWLGKPSVVEMDSFRQVPLTQATTILGEGEQPVCFGGVQIEGFVTGHMILAFDDASGLALADMLLDDSQPSIEWNELAISAVLETTNILCSAYLNSLSTMLSSEQRAVEILPTPPFFRQEYVESLLEFALMEQAATSNFAFVASTKFSVEATSLSWTLLLLPDSPSLMKIAEMLEATERLQ